MVLHCNAFCLKKVLDAARMKDAALDAALVAAVLGPILSS